MGQRQLPPNMPSPPSYNKVNPADTPVIYLSLSSETMPMNQLDEYAETLMAQRISTVPGVAQVQVFGAQKYAVRIQLDPRELANRGIGIDEVVTSVRASNVNLPTGVLLGPYTSYTVQANGRVSGCVTARGSGNPDLDAITCRIVEERSRFKPALDAQNRPVASQAHAIYVWSRGHHRAARDSGN